MDRAWCLEGGEYTPPGLSLHFTDSKSELPWYPPIGGRGWSIYIVWSA